MNEITIDVLNEIYEKIKTPIKHGAVLKSDEYLMDSPVVFKHNDKFYMSFIRIDKDCNHGYETLLAESKDLYNFKVLGNILTEKNDWDKAQTGGYALVIDNIFGGSNEIIKVDDKYLFAFIGGNKTGYETDPLSMGLGYTADINDLTKYHKYKDPVLTPFDKDARYGETRTIYKPCVFIDDKLTLGYKYVMAYNAKNETNRESIFLAVSNDGINYKRYLDTAIIDCFKCSPDIGINGDPEIVIIDDYYVMFYFIYNRQTKEAYNTFAVSTDLINWTKWEGNPLIKSEYEYENVYAHKQWVLKVNDIVYHFYCAVNDKNERFIALATSK